MCLPDGPAVTWETYEGQGSVVAVRPLAGDADAVTVAYPTFTPDAAVAVAGGRLVLVRVDPVTLELRLAVLDGTAVTTAVAVARGVVSVTATSSGDGMVVAWVDGERRLVVQRFTADLGPGPKLVVAEVAPPATIVAPRLAAAGDRAAVMHIERTEGDPRPLTDDPVPVLDHPPRSTTEAVTIVPASAGEAADSARLEPPSAGAGVAGWLGSTLFVVHGAGAPLVTVFET